MNIWTDSEETQLVQLVNEGGRSWPQIAAEIPGRSVQACANKAAYMRAAGHELSDPEREDPPGRGSRGRRPRNKTPKTRVSFRLAVDVKGAFAELCTATGEKPGALLRHAIAFALALGRDELYDVEISPYTLNGTGPRIAVEWSVPTDLLDELADSREAPHYAAAQHAVEHLLEAYGFTIDKT